MAETEQDKRKTTSALEPVDNAWGEQPGDNFGYASKKERHASRGLEDWEMVDQMSDSQPGIFAWLHTVVGAVIAGIVVFGLFAYAIYYFTYHYGTVLFKNWNWF